MARLYKGPRRVAQSAEPQPGLGKHVAAELLRTVSRRPGRIA